MRKKHLLQTLILCTALTVNVGAEDMLMPDTTGASQEATVTDTVTDPSAPANTPVVADDGQVDPTLAFFSALASCTPGTYTEQNMLNADFGQSMLTQQVIGLSDDKLTCNAVLMTPDNRVLTCAFPTDLLPQLNNQLFLEGILERDSDKPGKNAINSDLLWSKFKSDNCGLGS